MSHSLLDPPLYLFPALYLDIPHHQRTALQCSSQRITIPSFVPLLRALQALAAPFRYSTMPVALVGLSGSSPRRLTTVETGASRQTRTCIFLIRLGAFGRIYVLACTSTSILLSRTFNCDFIDLQVFQSATTTTSLHTKVQLNLRLQNLFKILALLINPELQATLFATKYLFCLAWASSIAGLATVMPT